MNGLIEELKRVTESKRVIQGEQLIMTKLLEVENFIIEEFQDETKEELKSIIVSLLLINNGEISMQCSLYIASVYSTIVEKLKNPQFWDINNMLISNTTNSTVIAFGYIVRRFGQRFKSQLPRIIEHICKNAKKIEFASIYCLRSIFKACGGFLSSYAVMSVDFVKKSIIKANQTTLIMGLKFFRTMVGYTKTIQQGEGQTQILTVSYILESIRPCLKDHQSAYVEYEMAYLISRCAYFPFSSIDKHKAISSEWVIGSSRSEGSGLDFKESISYISLFPSLIKLSIPSFLRLLGPELVYMNHSSLFSIIKSVSIDSIQVLVSLIPTDVRLAYFKDVLKDPISPSQIKLISLLYPDEVCLQEAANIIFNGCSNSNKELRHSLKVFFSSMAKHYPTLAVQYLQKALEVLISNPDISGFSSIGCIIVSSLSNPMSSCSQIIPTIKKFLDSGLSCTDICSKLFLSTLSFLCVLPESFIRDEIVEKSIERSINYILDSSSIKNAKFRSLLKYTLGYRARFYNEHQRRHLLIASIMNPELLSLSSFIYLSDLAPDLVVDQPLAHQILKAFISKILKEAPSSSLIIKLVSRPLPIGADLLQSPPGLSYKKEKVDYSLMKILKVIPVLVAACSKLDIQELIKSQMVNSPISSSKMLVLFSLVTSLTTNEALPTNLISYLLGIIESQATPLQQVVAECIAFPAKNKIELTGPILSYIESHPSVSSCIILSSLLNHVVFPGHLLSRAIIFLNSQFGNEKILPFAIHSFSSLIISHSIQITSSGIILNQFSLLFEALHSSQSLSPIKMYMCQELFCSLVETLSSELCSRGSPLMPSIAILLRTFEHTPASNGREIYYNCAKAVFTFANSLSHLIPIVFPMSTGISLRIQLAACSAFTYLLKFRSCNFKTSEIVPKVIELLQISQDSRASSFMVSIAQYMNDQEVPFWVSTIRRILVSSSLYENGLSSIEPVIEVKECCLMISSIICEKLSSSTFLDTDLLDDLISSVSRGAETDRISIQELAIPVLQKIIELFEDRIAEEGCRLLDLYDTQFSQAVKLGFQLDLSISGEFLSSYLNFATTGPTTQNESSYNILIVYLSGLKACPQRSSAYYRLATHLCTVSRRFSQIKELIVPFLLTLLPIFQDIVFSAMKLYSSRESWKQMSEFRELSSSFYGELLPAFVWLQHISSSVLINIDSFVSFLVYEVKLNKEKWMSKAAFDSLAVTIEFFGDKISNGLLELSLIVGSEYSEQNRQETNEGFIAMLDQCSSLLKPGSEFNNLRALIFSYMYHQFFSSKVLAYLLYTDSDGILKQYSPIIIDMIIEYHRFNKIDSKEAKVLFILVTNHNPSVSGYFVNKIIESSSDSVQFKIDVMALSLNEKTSNISIEALSRFCITSYKKGGMQLIGSLLISTPEIGVALLYKGGIKAAFLLSQKDHKNARVYLRFIELALSVMSTRKEGKLFAESVLMFCLSFLSELHHDSILDRKLVPSVVTIMQTVEALIGNSFYDIFSRLCISKIELVHKVLDSTIQASLQRKKASLLTEFSTIQRSAKLGDWQVLDIEEN